MEYPLHQGYFCVKTLVCHHAGDVIEKRIDTGVAMVTKANMSESEMQELLNPPLEKYLGSGN